MKEKRFDLTDGPIARQLVLFAVPMFIGGVFQLLYSTVDTVIVGRFLGSDAIAAIGATSSAMALLIYFSNGFTNAASLLVSQAAGSRNEKRIRSAVTGGIYSAFVLGAILGVLSTVLCGPILTALSTPENIRSDAAVYFRITCGLIIGQILYNVAAAILRAFGDSRTPLMFMVFSSLLNVALDLLTVIVFRMGVRGVAAATVVSQFVSALLCIVYALRRYPELRPVRGAMLPDGETVRSYLSIGTPMGLQNAALSVGMLVITRTINGFGSDITAAYTVGSKVESIATVAFSQLAFSFSVFAGQNYGAKQYRRISNGLKTARRLIGCIALAAAVLMELFAAQVTLLFISASNTAVLEAALKLVRIEAVFYPVLGFIWLYNSCLRGMGRIPITIVSSVIELLSKIGLSIGLSIVFGYTGIWWAAPVGWVLGLIPSLVYELRWEKSVKSSERNGNKA